LKENSAFIGSASRLYRACRAPIQLSCTPARTCCRNGRFVEARSSTKFRASDSVGVVIFAKRNPAVLSVIACVRVPGPLNVSIVLIFCIAGLLFIVPRARRTLGAYRILLETGHLIRSDLRRKTGYGTTTGENSVRTLGKCFPDGYPKFRRRGSPSHLVRRNVVSFV
jgi:hypothetical protein